MRKPLSSPSIWMTAVAQREFGEFEEVAVGHQHETCSDSLRRVARSLRPSGRLCRLPRRACRARARFRGSVPGCSGTPPSTTTPAAPRELNHPPGSQASPPLRVAEPRRARKQFLVRHFHDAQRRRPHRGGKSGYTRSKSGMPPRPWPTSPSPNPPGERHDRHRLQHDGGAAATAAPCPCAGETRAPPGRSDSRDAPRGSFNTICSSRSNLRSGPEKYIAPPPKRGQTRSSCPTAPWRDCAS